MEMLRVTSYDEKAARAAHRAEVARLTREPPRFLQALADGWLPDPPRMDRQRATMIATGAIASNAASLIIAAGAGGLNLSIEEIAHHEAGHAVAAIRFRKSFQYVTIDPNDYSRGRLMFKTSFNPGFILNMRTRVLCENNAIIALAGPIAGARSCNRKTGRGASVDFDYAVAMIGHICSCPEEAKAYIAWLKARSRMFVHATITWAQIEAVARELLTRPKGERRLSSQQVDEICCHVWEAEMGPAPNDLG
jgi:hypothetical protein